ncbi:MAG: DUF1572 domain-containing protein [Acidobacteriota bacterium]|nr:DUF1572 domain-containing protein [Acidobacteriota bacterium]MDH3530824.1 DUF1572 domain-containing protein [Acidobacteriota bacterium]
MVEVIENYRDSAFETFRAYKKLAEKAMIQVSDEDFFRPLCEESNSIAVNVKHISGNLESRFTDFLTSDGEKPDRDRDSEFIIDENARDRLMERWEYAWNILFDTIESLTADDFRKNVTVRGESHTIAEALNRQLTHYAYHIGQIVFLAKHFRSANWKTLSVPRNRSAEFNEFLKKQREDGKPPGLPLEGPLKFANFKK